MWLGRGWSMVGAWLEHGGGKKLNLFGARSGQGWGMVLGKVGAWLGHRVKLGRLGHDRSMAPVIVTRIIS